MTKEKKKMWTIIDDPAVLNLLDHVKSCVDDDVYQEVVGEVVHTHPDNRLKKVLEIIDQMEPEKENDDDDF
jgi:hypothetical protein